MGRKERMPVNLDCITNAWDQPGPVVEQYKKEQGHKEWYIFSADRLVRKGTFDKVNVANEIDTSLDVLHEATL